MKAKAVHYINLHKPDKNNLFPVSIKVTFARERRYYPTGIQSSQSGLVTIKTKEHRSEMEFVTSMLSKAITIIDDFGVNFTFAAFELAFLRSKAPKDTLETAFNDYVSGLDESQIGNKQTYGCALTSLLKFKPDAKLKDIDVKWLKGYEKYMLDLGRSVTTIGIYLRCVRAIMNSDPRITKDLYPFGKSKYEIPTGKKKKRALNLKEIGLIFNASLESGSTAEKMRDYWIFSYLCNGINIADFCALKVGDVKSDRLYYIRQKSKRTKRNVEAIEIILQPEALAIIKKHGVKSKDPHQFLFPHFQPGMPYLTKDKIVANLISQINDNMAALAESLNIDKPVTTYYARHSFATILKNSGAPIAMISEMFGHTSLATTQNYLDSFESEQKKQVTKALLDFKK